MTITLVVEVTAEGKDAEYTMSRKLSNEMVSSVDSDSSARLVSVTIE